MLFDHLVGAIKQRLRHSKAECLGGLQVNHQLEFGGSTIRSLGQHGRAPLAELGGPKP